MPARRYRTEIAGRIRAGLEFDSDIELDEFLLSRGIVLVYTPAAAAPSALSAERGQGRPSFNSAIANAVTVLETQLAACHSLSARARLVIRHLASSRGADALPSMSTVRTFLAVQKDAGTKSARKVVHARIHRTKGA